MVQLRIQSASCRSRPRDARRDDLLTPATARWAAIIQSRGHTNSMVVARGTQAAGTPSSRTPSRSSGLTCSGAFGTRQGWRRRGSSRLPPPFGRSASRWPSATPTAARAARTWPYACHAARSPFGCGSATGALARRRPRSLGQSGRREIARIRDDERRGLDHRMVLEDVRRGVRTTARRAPCRPQKCTPTKP